MTSQTEPTANTLLNALCYPEEARSGCRDAEFSETLKRAKASAIERSDELEAFQLWCAQTIYSIQRGFISAFESLKAGLFYEAWCQFECCEIDIFSLTRHYPHTDEDLHRILYIEQMIGRWQSLYPYKLFFSPELLKRRMECSICGTRLAPRSSCGHEKFKIYLGEMCSHKVTEVDILGISLVENPVQRYSVPFLSTSDNAEPVDHYNYGNVQFVIDRLDSCFHGWESHLTTRTIDASELAHMNPTRPCPCLSGRNFGDCCAGNSEVTVPHLQIQLYVQPSKVLPANELLLGEA